MLLRRGGKARFVGAGEGAAAALSGSNDSNHPSFVRAWPSAPPPLGRAANGTRRPRDELSLNPAVRMRLGKPVQDARRGHIRGSSPRRCEAPLRSGLSDLRRDEGTPRRFQDRFGRREVRHGQTHSRARFEGTATPTRGGKGVAAVRRTPVRPMRTGPHRPSTDAAATLRPELEQTVRATRAGLTTHPRPTSFPREFMPDGSALSRTCPNVSLWDS